MSERRIDDWQKSQKCIVKMDFRTILLQHRKYLLASDAATRLLRPIQA